FTSCQTDRQLVAPAQPPVVLRPPSGPEFLVACVTDDPCNNYDPNDTHVTGSVAMHTAVSVTMSSPIYDADRTVHNLVPDRRTRPARGVQRGLHIVRRDDGQHPLHR